MAAPVLDQLTGEQIMLLIVAEAGRRGRTARALVAQLSPEPDHWIAQFRRAHRPKPSTLARIAALLAGEPVPPPPPNNFQKRPYRLTPRTLAVGCDRDPPANRPRVDRDPCFFCGTRGDIGCRHQRTMSQSAMEMCA